MRAAILALLVAAAGCGVKPCKSNSVLVNLTLDAASAAADKLLVTVTVDGVAHTQTVAHAGRATSGSIEIDFAKGYPTGKQVQVRVQALAGNLVVGSGMGAVTATASCANVTFAVVTNGGAAADLSTPPDDLSGADLGPTVDLSNADLTPPPPDFAGCGYVFVSTLGSDAKSGCDPTVPKQTIGAAIAVTTAHDVMVCKGAYNENVNVSRTNLALHGGYDCTFWTRSATYGYPMFDNLNQVLIKGTMSGTPAVIVSGNGATVEGITALAANGAAMESHAMDVSSANAIIRDNQIVAGSTTGTTMFGSTALTVSGGGNDIFHNFMDGGAGTSSGSAFSIGSIGVNLGAQSHLHDNTIQPGIGSNTNAAGSPVAGAVGILVTGGANHTSKSGGAVENNVINPGNGSIPAGAVGASTLGIGLANGTPAQIDILNNVVNGGTGSNNTVGIWTFFPGMYWIKSNRVFGGKPTAGTAIALRLDAGTLTIDNNELHGGEPAGITAPEAIHLAVPGALIRHNTIVSGRSTNNGTPPAALNVGLHMLAGAQSSTTIANNLFLGEGTATAMLLDQCPDQGTAMTAWQANAYAFTYVAAYGAAAPGGGCSASTSFATPGAFAAELGSRSPTTVATLDLHLETSCMGVLDTCAAVAGCTNPHNSQTASGAPCAQGILAAYSQANDGVSDLLKAGWLLKTGTPCAVSKSGLDDTAAVPKDWMGTTRTPPPSIGAHEFDGTCN